MAGGVIAGVFVGGASRRMGGRAKGLLMAPGGQRTILGRWVALLADELSLDVVLVGRRPEYARVELPQLADAPSGVGPLGGLAALLEAAGSRRALAVACDMPYVRASDVRRLLATSKTAAARRGGRWEPLFAIYEPGAALPEVRRRIAARQLSLQALLEALAAEPVPIEAAHLDDWDRPEDVEPERES